MKLLHESGAKIKDGYLLAALMSQAYDMTYGIFDYDANPNRPLAPVAMHPAEDLSFKSPRRLRLRQYMSRNVWERTGLSFDAFLNRPREEVDMILEECQIKNDETVAEAEAVARAAGAVGTGPRTHSGYRPKK